MTKIQQNTLLVLRLLIGWHILYEGIIKLINPEWSSLGFLSQSQWILTGFANWVISHEGVLKVVDILNTWGLIAIGTGLILGLFARVAAYAGAVLIFIYYLNNPPFIGIENSGALEGNYLIVNKNLIEVAALVLLGVFPSSAVLGLDALIKKIKLHS
jgi:thiosulfate dehydrogenase [quinone] large subunit